MIRKASGEIVGPLQIYVVHRGGLTCIPRHSEQDPRWPSAQQGMSWAIPLKELTSGGNQSREWKIVSDGALMVSEGVRRCVLEVMRPRSKAPLNPPSQDPMNGQFAQPLLELFLATARQTVCRQHWLQSSLGSRY